jgi:hypothetical protein
MLTLLALLCLALVVGIFLALPEHTIRIALRHLRIGRRALAPVRAARRPLPNPTPPTVDPRDGPFAHGFEWHDRRDDWVK